jgi:MraZ protein
VDWTELPDQPQEVRMFLGTYAPRLDDKSRLVLPAKFREQFAEGLVITKGQERCLCVWPLEGFRSLTEDLRKAPLTSKGARDYTRVLFAGAQDEVPDRQGRVTIPPHLRDYAGLRRECAVIGANTRVEVWDGATWERYLAAQEDAFSALSQEVPPGLL